MLSDDVLGRMCTSYWDHCAQIIPWRLPATLYKCAFILIDLISAYLELSSCAVGSSRATQNVATALSTMRCGPCANAALSAASVAPQQAVGVVHGLRGMASGSVHLSESDVAKHFPTF